MKTVVLRGPVLTQSGYGVHARQVARWLLSRSDIDVRFNVLPWGDTPWILDKDACDGLVGAIMQRSVNHSHKADVSVQLQLPSEWDPSIAPLNIGVTAGVETDRCNPEWVQACNRMSMVIVPSTHARDCITNTGPVVVPMHVVPEAFSDAIASGNTKTLPDFSTGFNFLVFGQLTGNNPENDRKNTFYALKWLCEAFKDDKDVGIVLKTNVGRNSRIDRLVTRNLVSSVVAAARRGNGCPKVHLIHGDMQDDEIAGLYKHKQVKALVSLTRGEGYGLPILEAAASGLPVIATGWSGHLDFLRHGRYVNVYYQLGCVHPSRVDGKIFVKDARWANPSEDDFKQKVLKFRKNNDVPLAWASGLRPKILDMYNIDAVMKAYDDVTTGVI